MKRIPYSHLVSLVFRYGILILLGATISALWRVCRPAPATPWGAFYALWVPLLYALFSTGYLLLGVWHSSPSSTSREDTNTEQYAFLRFLSYDDYTYLFALIFPGLTFAAPHLKNILFWFSLSYLGLLVLKAGIFLAYLSSHIRRVHQFAAANRPLPAYLRVTLLLSALAFYTLISAYQIQQTTPTGDEPHYLLITHSLWHDHDTNLYNNYRDQDYQAFYRHELRPTWGDQVSESEIYSYRHKGGFPHTLIPGYVLGGQFGAVWQMNLLTALLMLQIFLLSFELFHSLTASFATWICIAFTIPVIVYMGQIYPETLAALFVVWTIRNIRKTALPGRFKDIRFWGRCGLIGATLLLLVMLKTRYLPLAATLALFLFAHLLRGRLHIRQKFRVCAGLGAFALVLTCAAYLIDAFFFDHMFRDRLNDTQYMAWFLKGHNPLFGALGLLFDQEYGLFCYTPLYMLALVGIGLLTREEWRESFPIIALIGLNYLVISLWPLWHAAPTPPSRYILPVIPLLGVFAARFFAQRPHALPLVLTGVCALWSGLAAWAMTLNPGWRYNWADGSNNFLEAFSHRLAVNLPKLFPSWIRPNPLTPYLTLGALFGIAGFIYLCRREAKRSRKAPKQGEMRHKFSPAEASVFPVFILFIGIILGGLALGKIMPTFVLEAEDALDVRVQGGTRVPPTLDPWDNQRYQREWKFAGRQLNSSDRLEARPTLSRALFPSRDGRSSAWDMLIYARTGKDDGADRQPPLMRVSVNGKEIGRVVVEKQAWDVYAFHFVSDDKRPLILIEHEGGAQQGFIIDKLRFR